jgi:hypothetical protein
MTRTPATWLAATLAIALLAAGCGSSSSSTTSSTAKTTAAPAAAPTATTPAGGSTSTSSTAGGANPAGVAEAVAVCKSVIAQEPSLSAEVKAKVESICNKAAHGDLAGARQAGKEVCVQVIDGAKLPQAAKEQALKGCQSS